MTTAMKKVLTYAVLTIALAALTFLLAKVSDTVVPPAQAAGVCDPQRSPLCSGLIAIWGMEESSAGIRLDAYGDTVLHQKNGDDVSVSSGTHKKLGSYGAGPFDGDDYLWLPRRGAFPSYGTLAFWYYPVDANPLRNQAIFTTQSCSSTTGTTTKNIFMDAPTSGCGTSPQWHCQGTSNPADAIGYGATSSDPENDSREMAVFNDNGAGYGQWVWDTPESSTPQRDGLDDVPVNAQITSIAVVHRSKKATLGSTLYAKAGVRLGTDTTLGPSTEITGTGYAAPYDSGPLTRPGGGGWTYADLANIKLVLEVQPGDGQREWIIDWAYLKVTYADCRDNAGISIYESADDKVVIAGFTAESETQWVVSSTSTVTDNAWNLVAVTFSPFGPYGTNQACISINGGPTSGNCGPVEYYIKTSPAADWLIGCWPNSVDGNIGYIDSFGIWSRTWGASDIREFYNNGSGKVFPFY